MMGDTECVEKLLEILKNYPSLRLTASSLFKPTTEIVVSIYQELLKAMGVDLRNLRKPLKSETQFQLSYYDTDFRFIMKLYAVLKLVLKESSPIEFDLMDLLSPGINVTYAAVATLNNCIIFRSSRKEELDKIVEQGREKIDKYKKLAARKERLMEEINYQSKQKAELSVLSDQLKSQISETEGRVFTLIEERENIIDSLEPLNKTLAEYDSKISKPETEAIKLVQTIEKLKNQIVSSPDQLVQNLENLKAMEQQKKEEERSISEELQQKKCHFERLVNCRQVANAVREEIKDINKLIDEIRNEEMEVERLETKKTKLNEEVCIKKEVVQWMKHTEADLHQKIKSAKEHLADKNKEAQKKMKELDKKIARVVKTIEECTRTKQDRAKELEEYKAKIAKEDKEQSYVLLKIEKESQDIIQEVKELTHAFNHLRQSLADVKGFKVMENIEKLHLADA